MTALTVVGRPVACAGFALAGLPTVQALGVAEGAALVVALADRPGAGVLLVEQELYDAIGDADQRAITRRSTPIIIPFPGPSWVEHAPPPESYVLDLLQRAIGYRVRLR